MFKKITSIVLVTLLVFSTFISTVSADSWHEKNNENMKKEYQKEVKSLKNQLKFNQKLNKDRLKFMKKIQKLKDKYKDELDFDDFDFDDFDFDDLWFLINGKVFFKKDSPVIGYGKFLLPTKPITKGLQADLKYDDKNHIITITKEDTKVVIDLDKEVVTVNGKKVDCDIFDKKDNNGTIVLIKTISKLLGYDVDEDDDDSDVIIIDDKYVQLNDNDVRLEYKGNWSYLENQKGAYKNDIHVSNEKDASVKVEFYGKEIRLYGVKGPDKGYVVIKLNGNEQLINLYSSTLQNNTVIYSNTELNEGLHTLEVKVTGIKHPDSNGYYVAIDRFEILGKGSNMWNIALKKPTSANSYQAANEPRNANDGSLDTRWCAADSGVNHWWIVDLEGYYNINGTEVIWELDNKIYKYKIDVSTNGSDWTLALDKRNNSSKQQVQNEKFNANSVRYVRITITGLEEGSWASFWELKVFGYPVSQTLIPGAPVSLTTKAISTNEISLTWKAPTLNASQVAGYKIYRDGKHIGTVKAENSTVVSSFTYKDTGLNPGTVYKYTVKAFNSQNVESNQGLSIHVSTLGKQETSFKTKNSDNNNFSFSNLFKVLTLMFK